MDEYADSAEIITDGPDFIIADEFIRYNFIQQNDRAGFNLTLLSKEKAETLEFISFEGENLTDGKIDIYDETFDCLKGYKRNGYYITLMGFQFNLNPGKTTITKINLKINGKSISKKLTYPIIHDNPVENPNDYTYICSGGQPLMIPSYSVYGQDNNFPYGFDVYEDTTFSGFSFVDSVVPLNATVSVNEINLGSLDNVLPLKLKAGDHMIIYTDIAYSEDVKYKKCTGVLTNAVLEYKTPEGKNKKIYMIYSTQSISNEDEAIIVIDYLTTKQPEE